VIKIFVPPLADLRKPTKNSFFISVQNKFQFLYYYFIHHGAIMKNKLRRFCFTMIYVVTKVLKIEMCSCELNI